MAHVQGGTFKRTRRHEALIAEYGSWVRAEGFVASTAEHPKDLVVVEKTQRCRRAIRR